MVERTLQDVNPDAPVKRAVPTWVWGCGCGCLVIVLLMIGSVFWLANRVKTIAGPEAAWTALAEIAPFRERPTETFPFAFVVDPGGFVRIFTRDVPGDVPDFRLIGLRAADGLQLNWFSGSGVPFGESTGDARPLVLQGRAVEARRFVPHEGDETLRRAGMDKDVAAWAIDLGPRSGRPLILIVQRDGGNVDLERLDELLAPFDLWATADAPPPQAEGPR